MPSQLATLTRPFKDHLIHKNPSGGGQYVGHDVVTQKLLMVVGPFDFELVEIIRGHVPAKPPNPKGTSDRAKNGTPALEGCLVGAVCRLSCVIDGIPVKVEEVGDCEDPNNWPHDGARMKDAMSDAIKRCAMRLGVGIHLWAQNEFILSEKFCDEAVERRKGRVSLDLPEPESDAGETTCGAHGKETPGLWPPTNPGASPADAA